MEFAPPVWISKLVCYKFKINDTTINFKKVFTYATDVGSQQQTPDVNDDGFSETCKNICDEFLKAYTKWFPGRGDIRMTNLKHNWSFDISPDLKDGVEYEFIWKPTAFFFGGATTEIHWSLIDSSGINKLEDAEIGELPCSSDTPSLYIALETRRNYRKRVRQARLKAALAELKATKMAEEYYRRYEAMDESADSDLDETDNSEGSDDSGSG